jgi:hypothetical protein
MKNVLIFFDNVRILYYKTGDEKGITVLAYLQYQCFSNIQYHTIITEDGINIILKRH